MQPQGGSRWVSGRKDMWAGAREERMRGAKGRWAISQVRCKGWCCEGLRGGIIH